ncbi:hypothetical protein EVB27_079 [Rhizobium phage RHph_TM16]|nr:hypothetical protein EVB27_079 [Rhizobium phage RHph_TM16]
MKTSEFNKQMKPFRKRLRDLHREFVKTFEQHMVDADDPEKKVSEGQADRLDAVIEALEAAVDNAAA